MKYGYRPRRACARILAQLWVHKFRSQGQLYLLGYTREDVVRLIYLEAMGPHENFYLDLKR
ncbi:MAG: type II toxin-antitoxin system RelE/ParE family toxin [Burkholderiales bacterium]|nr:type II toxin-antitoxin system RelE/ParE family toxin [Burkholderiales bacterium]